jgi:RNA recognition motif-containing protein
VCVCVCDSPTSFVANLPFKLDDEGLKAVFEGFTVTSAHVVKRKYGATQGRSKGFGFVELADEAEQQRALETLNAKELEGRPIQVKVAIEADKEAAMEDTGAAAALGGTNVAAGEHATTT